jgi:hypothetical protein
MISTNPKDLINFDTLSSKIKMENADSYVSNIKKEAINFGGHKAIGFYLEDFEYLTNAMYVIQTQDTPKIQFQFLIPHKIWDEFPDWYVGVLKLRARLITSSFLFNDADVREGRPDRIMPVETKKSSDSMSGEFSHGITEAVYTSPELGVSFKFTFEFAPGIEREGDKICWDGWRPESGDNNCFVHAEVFSKNPSQSLKEAIEEKILAGYDKNKCLLEIFPDVKDKNKELATMYFAYAKAPYYYLSTGVDGPWENAESCPKYTQQGPIQYFMTDKNFPDKFVYFLIMHQSYPSAFEMTSLEFIK